MRPDSTRQNLASLARRVAALERRLDAAVPARPARGATRPRSAEDGGAFELLDGLRQRRGKRYARGGVRGAVGYAGHIQVDDRRYAWAREVAAPELLDAPASEVARLLSAVASPQRIALLQALFGRDKSSADLTHALGDPSPGHIYHHLKELQAAGILVQPERGAYRIAPAALVPVFMMIAAAADVIGGRGGGSPEPFPLHAVEADA